MKQVPPGPGGRGKVFVISAPSGTGKTTLVKALRSRFPFLEQSVSCTTRKPRTGEKNGKDYYFITEEEFQRRVAEDYFFEWAEVYGHHYGTPKKEIVDRVTAGRHVVSLIDVQGALAVKTLLPDDAVLIFVIPPSIEALRARITGRALDDPAAIERRLEEAKRELRRYVHYDYVVVNDELEEAVSRITAVIEASIFASRRYHAARIEEMLS